MIAMLRELSVPMTDLRYLSIECECGTKITVDLTKQAGLVEICPVCQQYFDNQLKSDVMGLGRTFKNASGVNYKLSFRVTEPAPASGV